MVNHLQHGDKVWTPALRLPGKRHYAIWDAQMGMFIHNTHPGGVQYTAPAQFINQRLVIEKRAAMGYGDEVVRRATALLGRNYDLLLFNCEHFVNYAADGAATSPQLRDAAVGGLMIAGLIGLVNAASGGPKYDPGVGQYRDRKGRFARG